MNVGKRPEGAEALASALSIQPLTACLLLNRGLGHKAEARDFLFPSIDLIPDPFLIKDMEKGVDKVIHAIQNNLPIALYGDYDVDGISGSALLARFFREIGVETKINIPHRLEQGYGLHIDSLKKLSDEGYKLLITIDSGATDIKEILAAKEMGMDVIVTDHHHMEEMPSDDFCIINPSRSDSEFPDKRLSGSAVAFMFAVALRKKMRNTELLKNKEPHLGRLINLAALGIIADIVPLTGVNRILAKIGLKGMANAHQPGIKELVRVCRINGNVDGTAVSFRIAPRINAAGRMGEAESALELLLTEDMESATNLAERLSKLNSARQKVEEKLLGEAKKIAKENSAKGATVVWGENWHQGVMGIVASKLLNEYQQPSVVISFDDQIGRGSLRGLQNGNIIPALMATSYLLEGYGGHAQAAGISIKKGNVEEFAQKFALLCRKQPVTPDNDIAEIEALPGELTRELASEMELLEPFGPKNPKPKLLIKRKILEKRIVAEKHLKLWLDDNGNRQEAIGFGMAEQLPNLSDEITFTATPKANHYNGKLKLELVIDKII